MNCIEQLIGAMRMFWNNEICRVLILERADAGPWSRLVFSRDNLAQSITILM
jgi:hypothetical protein